MITKSLVTQVLDIYYYGIRRRINAPLIGIMQSVAGWDWIQGTPDRNTGIWDEVP